MSVPSPIWEFFGGGFGKVGISSPQLSHSLVAALQNSFVDGATMEKQNILGVLAFLDGEALHFVMITLNQERSCSVKHWNNV